VCPPGIPEAINGFRIYDVDPFTHLPRIRREELRARSSYPR
jgi:hypothetical protein